VPFGHFAPGKRALGKTWGACPPGSYAPARTPYTAPVILYKNCKDYLTLTIRISGIKIKSKLVRNLYAGNEIKQHDVDSLTSTGFVVSKTKKIQRLSKICSAHFQRLFKDL
jgi:hypothetical protein